MCACWFFVQKIASKKTSAVFREMIRAYAGQMLGTPYEFPSYHTVRAIEIFFGIRLAHIGGPIW